MRQERWVRHRKGEQALYKLLSKRVKPEAFCERWFSATEEDKRARGYRAKCVKLLSRVLGVEADTIDDRWGSGYTFDKMPEQYEVTLQYVDTLRQMIQASTSSRGILEAVLEQMREKPE